jgi:hypothetical protein
LHGQRLYGSPQPLRASLAVSHWAALPARIRCHPNVVYKLTKESHILAPTLDPSPLSFSLYFFLFFRLPGPGASLFSSFYSTSGRISFFFLIHFFFLFHKTLYDGVHWISTRQLSRSLQLGQRRSTSYRTKEHYRCDTSLDTKVHGQR